MADCGIVREANPRIEIVGRTYLIDGRRYTRLSEVVENRPNPGLDAWRKRVGPEEEARILRETSDYGDRVHKATMLHDLGREEECRDFLSDDPEVIPAFMSWYEWANVNVTKWILIEGVVWSMKDRTAGTIDRIGIIRGDKKPAIEDLKTGRLTDSIGVKLAGYKKMWNEMIRKKSSPYYGMPKVERRIAVGLHRDEKGEQARIKEYTREEKDLEEWNRMVEEYNGIVELD